MLPVRPCRLPSSPAAAAAGAGARPATAAGVAMPHPMMINEYYHPSHQWWDPGWPWYYGTK